MQTQQPGYPRTGSNREHKKAYGNYSSGKISVFTDPNVGLPKDKLPQAAETDHMLFHDFQFNNLTSDVPLFYVRIA